MYEWDVFNALSDRTTTSEVFKEFLKSLLRFITRKLQYKLNQILLILDNWSINMTNLVKNWTKDNNVDLFYITPYTPEFACVRLTLQFSKRVSRYESNGTVDLKGAQ